MPVLSRQEESLTRRQDLPVTDTGSQKKTDIRLQNYIRLWFPMEVREWYAKELQGLSLRNVSAAVYDGKKKLYEDFGEMLLPITESADH